MSDLTEFLLARIAEDEVVARQPEQNAVPDGSALVWDLEWGYDEPCITISTSRVLAECEAKRRIVAAIDDQRDYVYAKDWDRLQTDHHLDKVLRLLAQPYADHPDYREEWRP